MTKLGPRKRMLPNAADIKALQLVYELAVEASHSSQHADIDDDGVFVGIDPTVQRALDRVREAFGLKVVR